MAQPLSSISTNREESIRDAMRRLDTTALGHLLLVDSDGKLGRVVTDGDLRRLLLAGATPDTLLSELPAQLPITAPMNMPVDELMRLFEEYKVDAIPRVDRCGRPRILERRADAGPILLSTPHLGDEEASFVQQAFDTNWIAPLGPQVESFERELADYVGVRHASATSSGTAALHLALLLLGVSDGDRVYCSSFTFAASANPIRYERATPVFIDSDRYSWNMSARALERALATDKARGTLPKAVIVANLYGQSADMNPLTELCESYAIPLIEDAAESLGARYRERMSGSFGYISIFSFNGNKIITTSGGGALCSDDADLIARAKFLATQAREPVSHYEHREIGYNYRLSNVLAGIGRGQLRVIESRITRRREIFERYRASLSEIDALEWMPEPEGFFSTRWLSALRLKAGAKSSSSVLNSLHKVGIEARALWKPMHRQPVFEGVEFFADHEGFSVCDDLFLNGLCLPSGSALSDDAIDRVAEQLRFALES